MEMANIKMDLGSKGDITVTTQNHPQEKDNRNNGDGNASGRGNGVVSTTHDVVPCAPTGDVEFANDSDNGVMVEIFEESDLDTDTENKLQLYSDEAIEVVDTFIATGKPEQKRTHKEQREPSRLSLEDRIKVIRMCSRYSSMADVQKAWKQKYRTLPPCRKTLTTLNKKFQKTGSVADLVRTGRPKTTRTEAVVTRVEEAIRKDPSKSIRTLAKELGINQASVHRIKKEYEDKRNTLKLENKKLKDRLNDALKRVILLERRLSQNYVHTPAHSEINSDGKADIETLVITSPSVNAGTSFSTQIDGSTSDASGPTVIALNSTSANGQISIPSVLRLQQAGHQDVIHIITIPQSSSHQLLSLDDSSSIQLAIQNDSIISQSQVPNFHNSNQTYSSY